MESGLHITEASVARTVDPADIVRQVMALTEGYGLEKGQCLFESAEQVMGFAPWWNDEVRQPVMAFFKEERRREQRERHEMEVERLRAGTPNVTISQPSAQTGVAMPYGGIGQLNMLENGASASYGKMPQN